MFNRRLLVISVLVAGCSIAANSYAQEAQRGDGVRGKPTRGELRDGRGLGRQNEGRMLRRLDTDGDTLISLAEFTANSTANYSRQFDRADSNDDNFVSAQEFGPRRRGPAQDIDVALLRECIADKGGLPELEEDRFEAADSDGDGVLSQEEYFMHLEQRAFDQFARMDADADGQLSKDELVNNMEGRHEQRRIVKECIGEQIDPFL